MDKTICHVLNIKNGNLTKIAILLLCYSFCINNAYLAFKKKIRSFIYS